MNNGVNISSGFTTGSELPPFVGRVTEHFVEAPLANLSGLTASLPSSERRYQQLFHVDPSGTVMTRDLQRVLSILACKPEEPSLRVPSELNEHVMRIRRLFAEE